MKKSKKDTEFEQKIGELTQDLQRTRADFENYRKRIDAEKVQAIETGKMQAIFQLLPIIDNIDRAILHLPKELKGNSWAEGVCKMSKNLDKMLTDLNLQKIEIKINKTEFDSDLHEAISMEDGDGDKEVISEELQTGWQCGEQVIRHAMVRVKRV